MARGDTYEELVGKFDRYNEKTKAEIERLNALDRINNPQYYD